MCIRDRSYTISHYRADALFSIGQIQQQDMERLDDAKATFQEFLKQFPHADNANDARVALDQIAEAQAAASAPPAPAASAPADPGADSASPAHFGPQANDQPAGGGTSSGGALAAKGSPPPRVTSIRSWNGDDYTRIVVDLDNSVKFQSSRIFSPDRIYFDLYGAKLAPGLAGKTYDINNGFLKSIRAGQNKAGVVRLVLDVDSVQELSLIHI